MIQTFLRSSIFAFFVVPAMALAACPQGATQTCTTDEGKEGRMECIGLRWGPCEQTEVDAITASMRVSYVIATVVYSPPGSKNGSPSSVSYGTGSSAGSSVTTSSSFQNAHSISASTATGSVGGSFSHSRTSDNSSSLDISKSQTTTISFAGPRTTDGVDNKLDAIYLLVGPTIRLNSPPETWRLDASGGVLQYVHPGWLTDPSSMPPGVKAVLDAGGVAQSDYQEILRASIYHGFLPVNASNARLIPAIDNLSIPYIPPASEGAPSPTFQFRLEASTRSTASSSVARSYTVGVSNKVGITGVFSLTLDNKFTWTSKESRSTAQGQTESSTLTLTSPSFGYTGPTSYRVYLDSLYKTFVFVPIDPSGLFASGKIMRRNGKPAAGERVVATVNGIRYRTWTGTDGKYQIYGPSRGRLVIQSAGMTKAFANIPASKVLADIKL